MGHLSPLGEIFEGLFLANFSLISLFCTPVAWNLAYASDDDDGNKPLISNMGLLLPQNQRALWAGLILIPAYYINGLGQ